MKECPECGGEGEIEYATGGARLGSGYPGEPDYALEECELCGGHGEVEDDGEGDDGGV